MGGNHLKQVDQTEPETEEALKERLKRNYLALAGATAPLSWLYENWEPLLRIYFPAWQQEPEPEPEPVAVPWRLARHSVFPDKEAFLNFYSGVKVPA